jgi:spore maturation protein CgeB
MLKTYKFFLEKSPTPIYQRIIENIKITLIEFGHEVVLLNLDDFQTNHEYIDFINQSEFDYFIITNSNAVLVSSLADADTFLFEKINLSLIFIHHDNPFSKYFYLKDINSSINAYLRIKDKSFHFFIEYSNFIDFKCLGINNSFHVYHSSEFKPIINFSFRELEDVSFVGHILPNILPSDDEVLDQLPYSHLLKCDYWSRIVSLDKSFEESSRLFSTEYCSNSFDEIELYTLKYFYRAMLHKLSFSFRGEIIGKINEKFSVNIFGGDPSYLHKTERSLKLKNKNLNYHLSTDDYQSACQIYAKTKINLNITSLQFDTAVINRVMDIGASGGFVLTDWKSDLAKITSVSEQISYRTIDELNSKIEYYLSHDKERNDISFQFHDDIVRNCSYCNLIDYILSQLNPMELDQSKPFKVDLGCGPTKPDGFIGVDIGFQPGVDIVADLNRRFPFADSSIDVVRAHDTIEHLHDRLHTMNEIWRICKPGALVEILVPSTDGRGAFQDPTHVSYWNINSFRYYCIEFPSYLHLCQKYGFKGQFSLALSEHIESQDQVTHVFARLTALKSQESHNWIETIDLKATNFIVFIDWTQSEDFLSKKIIDLFQSVNTRADLDSLGILFYLNGQVISEDAQLIISGVIMDLYLQEIIEHPEFFHISFVSETSDMKWELLVPMLSGQVALDNTFSSSALNTVPTKSLLALQENSFGSG